MHVRFTHFARNRFGPYAFAAYDCTNKNNYSFIKPRNQSFEIGKLVVV